MAEIDLAYLRYHWGEAYRCSRRGKRWVAVRRDNQRQLSAGSGRALRDAVMADYLSEPVPRDAIPGVSGGSLHAVLPGSGVNAMPLRARSVRARLLWQVPYTETTGGGTRFPAGAGRETDIRSGCRTAIRQEEVVTMARIIRFQDDFSGKVARSRLRRDRQGIRSAH